MANDKKNDYANLLWDRAEECRAIAEILTDATLKAEYRALANAYLTLAAQEERLRRAKPDSIDP